MRPYQIVLRGDLGPRFEDEFEGMSLRSEEGKTYLWGDLDQSKLHGVLDRIQSFNLRIFKIEEVVEDTRRARASKNEETNE